MEQTIKTIKQTLEGLHAEVYFNRAGKNTQDPYIVFKIPLSDPEEYKVDTLTLEINIWGKVDSSPNVYTLSDSIESELNMKRILTENHLLMFPEASWLEIPDPDPLVKRIQLRYFIRKHKR